MINYIAFTLLLIISIGLLNLINVNADIPRCADDFDVNNPKTNEREHDILKTMLETSEYDSIVKNLLLQSGKITFSSSTTLRGSKPPIPSETIYKIPIIFHRFTDVEMGKVVGNVPMDAFEKQINVLNKAFKPAGLQFKLQKVITYKHSPYFRSCESVSEEMKNNTGISNEKYLNVWVCDPTPKFIGQASYPWSFPDKPKQHGIIVDYKTLPAVKNYNPKRQYNEGDSLVHEIGHFFGLYHTFEGGCNGGDDVSDTPAEAFPAFGNLCMLIPPRDSCPTLPGNDPVQNFMNYSDDICMDEFTPLQYARMRAMFLQYKIEMSGRSRSPTLSPTTTPTSSPTKTPTKKPRRK